MLGWKLLAPVVGFALAATAAPALDKMEYVEMAPDSLMAVVAAPDMAALRERYADSPVRAALADDEVSGLVEYLRDLMSDDKASFEEDTGVDLEAMMDRLQGFAGFFLLWSDGLPGPGLEGWQPPAVIVVEIAPDETDAFQQDVDALIDHWVPRDANVSLDTFGGIEIFQYQYTEDGVAGGAGAGLGGLALEQQSESEFEYAFHDGRFLMSDTLGTVQSFLASYEGAASGTVRDRPGFREAVSAVAPAGREAPDLVAWMDLPGLVDSIAASVREDGGSEASAALDQSGLLDIGGIALSMSIRDDRTDFLGTVRMPANKAGLLPILYAGSQNPLETPKLAPRDVHQFTSWTLDVQEVWETALAYGQLISPQITMVVQGQLDNIRVTTGLDLKADLVDNLRGEHAAYVLPLSSAETDRLRESMPGMPEEMLSGASATSIFLATANGQAVVTALDKFLGLAQEQFSLPLERSDRSGFGVWQLREDAGLGPVDVNLVLSPRFLVYSNSREQTAAAVRAVAGDTGGASLADSPEFQRAINGLRGDNLRVVNFTSAKASADGIDELKSLLGMLGGNQPLEAEDLPSGEWYLRYFGPTAAFLYAEPDGLMYEVSTFYAEGN